VTDYERQNPGTRLAGLTSFICKLTKGQEYSSDRPIAEILQKVEFNNAIQLVVAQNPESADSKIILKEGVELNLVSEEVAMQANQGRELEVKNE
jgi:hypothetical protein